MNFISLFKQIWPRLLAESPTFHKKIQAFSLYILLAILAGFGLEYLDVFTIPEKISGAMIAVAAYFFGSGSAAATAVKDPDKVGISEDSKYKPKD